MLATFLSALDGMDVMSQLSRRVTGLADNESNPEKHGGWMSEESFEEQQETLDPHRREERDG
ncbi:MAG: hypothetical protein ACXWM9_16510, partial [Gemmatimonadaceae bacterium]